MPEITTSAASRRDTPPPSMIEPLAKLDEDDVNTQRGNFKLGAQFALVFMLLGSALDYFVLPSFLAEFMIARGVCALLLGGVLLALDRPHTPAAHRVLGHLVALLPLITILWMIDYSEGAKSSYYAGINLVLVGAALLLRWSTVDGIINALFCVGGFAAVALHKPEDRSMVFNNSYFIAVTAVFTCVATYSYNRLRREQHRLVTALEKSRNELEDSNNKLHAQDKAKTDFFANVSHELRTPLMLVISPLEQLRRAPGLLRDAKSQQIVSMIEENGLRLLRQFDDLKELIQLDGNTTAVSPSVRTNFRHFIGNLVDMLRATATNRQIHLGHHFETDAGDDCWIDRDKMERIVLNLAINALKFTPANGRIDIDASIKGPTLRLEVRDTGKGIEKEQQTLVFERFYQADMSSRRSHGGVGLGLSLVKSIVQSLGGSIEIESEVGKGTSFVIKLPLYQGEATAPVVELETHTPRDFVEDLHKRSRLSGVSEAEDVSTPINEVEKSEATAADQQPLRALVADDTANLRNYLAEAMEGFEVIQAVDGQAAWERAVRCLPDVIILDYMMPEIDGLALTRKLRGDPATSRIPILVITANVDNSKRIEALEAGANEFITKPFSTIEFNARVRNLVRHKEYERDLAASKLALEVAHEQLRDNASRLIRAERLSALGRMCAGIIHEVNNPLNYASTALYALKAYRDQISEEDRPDFEGVLADAKEGVMRVSKIVGDLRTFTKGAQLAMSLVNLQAIVETSRRLTAHDLTGIELIVNVPGDLVVYGNDTQLSQVFINLLQNASSFVLAARDRGETPRIEITARPTAEGGVEATVRDNGCGIAPENLTQIFEPFFSRRDDSAGMGLGLSITQQILIAHGASITAHSELHQYTEFCLCFPPADSTIKSDSSDLVSP